MDYVIEDILHAQHIMSHFCTASYSVSCNYSCISRLELPRDIPQRYLHNYGKSPVSPKINLLRSQSKIAAWQCKSFQTSGTRCELYRTLVTVLLGF